MKIHNIRRNAEFSRFQNRPRWFRNFRRAEKFGLWFVRNNLGRWAFPNSLSFRLRKQFRPRRIFARQNFSFKYEPVRENKKCFVVHIKILFYRIARNFAIVFLGACHNHKQKLKRLTKQENQSLAECFMERKTCDFQLLKTFVMNY